VAAGALLNGGYGPSESYRTAVFGALGYYSSFVLYICMSFGNVFVPWIVAKSSLEGTMTFGAALYFPFCLAFALALCCGWGEALFLPLSAALGLGASALRTTQVVYVTDRSRGYDAARPPRPIIGGPTAPSSSLGLFNGIMSGAVSAITVTLDIAASFLLNRGVPLLAIV
jgi:hypothetical protein